MGIHPVQGGGGRIRTSDTIAGIAVFETAPFDHSGTPPLYTGFVNPCPVVSRLRDYCGDSGTLPLFYGASLHIQPLWRASTENFKRSQYR